MGYPLPPWISQPADPAAQYATGLGIGVRIGAEQAAQQYQQQQMLRAQAQDEFERQYKTQVLNMEVDKAMRKQRAGQAFQSLVQQGVAPEVALMQVGADLGESMADILRVQGLTEQRQAANELAQARIAATSRSADLREKEAALREKNINRLAERYTMSDSEKQRVAGIQKQIDILNKQRLDLDPEEEGNKTKRFKLAMEAGNLQKQIDKITATAPVQAAAATEPAPVEQRAQPTSPAASGSRVKVIAPDGKRGTIPVEQLEEALKAGYKQAE